MLKTETIQSGASNVCSHCKVELVDDIQHSPAGYYIGTYCDCGPYSRESEYFRNYDEARLALQIGDYGRW